MWVSGPPRPESIKAFCVGILDGGKLQAVGWMIDCLHAFALVCGAGEAAGGLTQ
jgi:hypothetical protein